MTLTGTLTDGHVAFELPMAVPPDGRYDVTIDGSPSVAEVSGGSIVLPAGTPSGRISVVFV